MYKLAYKKIIFQIIKYNNLLNLRINNFLIKNKLILLLFNINN